VLIILNFQFPEKFVDYSYTSNSQCIRPSSYICGKAAVHVYVKPLLQVVRMCYKCIIIENTKVTLCNSCSEHSFALHFALIDFT